MNKFSQKLLIFEDRQPILTGLLQMPYTIRKKPFVAILIDAEPKPTQKDDPKSSHRRSKSTPMGVSPPPSQENSVMKRYGRCKSAPTDFLLPSHVHKPSKSILSKLHPSFRQVFVLLAIYLGVGTLCFYFLRDHIKGKKTGPVLDAIYFCIVTMTTVGYGDLVPDTVATKLLSCAFVFTGMALVVIILSKAADYLVEKQEALLLKALYKHKKAGVAKKMKCKSNIVKYKLYTILGLLLLLIIVGTIVIHNVEGMDLVDSFYCVCSTITTLGYGDKSFSTHLGRIFAVFYLVTSTICVAQCFLYLAELKTQNRQRSLVKWVIKRRMTHIDLLKADLDDDGVVSAAEFIIYKLKEIGKINQEDIALVMEEFQDVIVETLPASDISRVQSSQTDLSV